MGDAISQLRTSAYTVPLDKPESDGTLVWDHTTVVVVEADAGGLTGLGFTYGPSACRSVVDEMLRPVVVGRDPLDVPGVWSAMVHTIRNAGRPGICSMAIAAVDIALWDLKAKLAGLPLCRLLGMVSDTVPAYGSGGFTSLSDAELSDQLGGWAAAGFGRVKMKIGRDPGADADRMRAARAAIGNDVELFVDANGAYTTKQAARMLPELEDLGVTWLEEPVSSDDLAGLRTLRALTGIDIAAGEYGYDLVYFARMTPSVDVLQADVSRCAGITEWQRVAAVAAAHGLRISGHCAQSLHAHVATSVPNLAHLEYFADHARVDRLLFDGVLDPHGGVLRPDTGRPGIGLELKRADAGRYAT